jgi:hypothetical protein
MTMLDDLNLAAMEMRASRIERHLNGSPTEAET